MAKGKKIKLTVWERIQIVPILNTSKGFKLEELKDVLDDAKTLMVSPEEQAEIGFEIIGEKNEKGEYTNIEGCKWNPELAKDKEFELCEPVKKFLVKYIEDKEKGEGFNIKEGMPWVELFNKIKE